MAAGLDPARFWQITPRLYETEMDGAFMRLERERSLVWFGAMLPHLKKVVSHDDFVRPRRRTRRQGRIELQAMCDALAAAWGAKRIDT